MPELPEVEIIAGGLRKTVVGKIIQDIIPVWDKSFENRSSVKLSGQRIESIGRKGKYLIIRLTKTSLIVHLRMTGQILYSDQINKDQLSHIRVKILFNDGSCVLFKDTRKFGRIYYLEDERLILSKVGIDALDPQINLGYFSEALKKSRMNIKAFLLSQKYISGIGNIYVDESLFRARIHPASAADKIKDNNAGILYNRIREVLNTAIENMGSTISDYRDTFGNSGNNQNYFKVYQCTGQPCEVCNTPIKKIKLAGRGTHFCPSCQKILK